MTSRIVAAAFMLIAAVSIVSPPAARAEPFGPDENLAYEIAIAYWGREPTQCATIAKSVEPLEGNEGGQATRPSSLDSPNSLACELKIASRLVASFNELCLAMTHEVGHLLGLGHSADPQNIMSPEIGDAYLPIVPGCQAEQMHREIAAEAKVAEELYLRAVRRWRQRKEACVQLTLQSQKAGAHLNPHGRSARCWAWVRLRRGQLFAE